MLFKRRDGAMVKKLQDGALYFLFSHLHDDSKAEARYQDRGRFDSEAPEIRYSRRDCYANPDTDLPRVGSFVNGAELAPYTQSRPDADIDSLLNIKKESGFVEKLIEYINSRALKNSDIYKAAGIDRRLFSKIISDPGYTPAKDTAVALALALQLSFSEAADFISRAGYSFSRSIRRDIILEYFFSEKFYDISIINEVLFNLNEKTLGR